MGIKSEAKMKTIEEVTKKLNNEKVPPMVALAMNMHTMSTISLYEEYISELGGNISKLLDALEEGGFQDKNGTNLNDTITFKRLKDQLDEN